MKFRILALSVLAVSVAAFPVLAADVTIVDSFIGVTLTVGTEDVVFEIQPANLTGFSTATDKISITTPAGERASIVGPSNISFGAATVCDTPGKSRIIIEQDTAVIITPTKPASTAAEFKNTCDGRVTGGGAIVPVTPTLTPPSGGGSGSSVPVSIPVPPATPEVPKEQPAVPVEEGGFTDLGKLKAPIRSDVLKLVEAMRANSGYKIPANKKFGPSVAMNGEFALQSVLGISGIVCTGDSCKMQAVEKKIVTNKFSLSKKPTRFEYYKMLLQAFNVKLESSSVKELQAECKDVKKTTREMARVYKTAKNTGLASAFSGGKCNLAKTLSRAAAAQVAVRTLQ